LRLLGRLEPQVLSSFADREVLDYFQDEGPGRQERLNRALRRIAGLD
jgi:uncharacterized protein (DUF4415 family)